MTRTPFAVSPPPPMPDAVLKALKRANTRKASKPLSTQRLAELARTYFRDHQTPAQAATSAGATPHTQAVLALQAQVEFQWRLIDDLSAAIFKLQKRMDGVLHQVKRQHQHQSRNPRPVRPAESK
jgi:hypothetical protein